MTCDSLWTRRCGWWAAARCTLARRRSRCGATRSSATLATATASASADGEVRLWATTQGSEAAFLPHSGGVGMLAYTRDGRHLVATGGDRSVRVRDTATSRVVVRIPAAHGARSIAIEPTDGRHLVLPDDRQTRVIDTRSGQAIETLKMTEGTSHSAYAADGRRLTAAGLDSVARIGKMPTGVERSHSALRDGIGSIALGPAGRLAVASTVNTDVAVVWETDTGKEFARFGVTGGYRQVTFCPGGGCIVAASPGSGGAEVREAVTGAIRHRLADAGAILAFSPDGKQQATPSGDGSSACIGRWSTGACIARLPHAAPIVAGTFLPDGTHFLTGARTALLAPAICKPGARSHACGAKRPCPGWPWARMGGCSAPAMAPAACGPGCCVRPT